MTEKVDKDLEEMYETRTQTKCKDDPDGKNKLEEVENKMADKYSEDMYTKLKRSSKVLIARMGDGSQDINGS